MQLPDFVNAGFELFAGAFILLNVRDIWKHRMVAGVHPLSTTFFFSWGLWNIFYYPHLDQWWSFLGGLFVVAVNAFYLFSILKFRERSVPGTFNPEGSVQ